MGVLTVYVVRHGATAWNEEGRLQGQTDIPLNVLGRWQAERVAERLSPAGLLSVYSSDLSRASETAATIAERHGVPVQTSSHLRERMLGDWEGLTEAEIIDRGDGVKLKLYRQDSVKFPSPGSEPLETMWQRMRLALELIREAHSEGSVAVIGHGSSLRVWLCEALGAGADTFRRLVLDNASVSVLEFGRALSRVRLVNDTSHLRNGTRKEVGR